MTTGEKIRYQRRLCDMKQDELSKQIGVSLKTIQRWENGERSPRLEEMNKLAEVLKVPASYFMGDNDATSMMVKDEQSSSERKQNVAMLTLENGKRVEAPATPEGYAFLKEVFAMSLAGSAQVVPA